MAMFPDGTDYDYLPSQQRMLNVGWLGAGVEFPTGIVSPEVIHALLRLASAQENMMRGVHNCEFCSEESPIRIPAPGPNGSVILGMGEIHVRASSGRIFSAPSLVIHYIVKHRYCPPLEFQEAVLESLRTFDPAHRDESP